MPRALVGNTNFYRGQIDPALYGRVETELYQEGVKEMTNFRITAGGSVRRRPGFEYVCTAAGGTGRLIPFEMTSSERYICHFYASNVKIYDEDGNNVATLASPWDATEVWELDFTQNVSTMVITHRSHKPRLIKRTAVDTFTIGEIEWDYQDIHGQDTRSFEPFFQYSTLEQYLTVADESTTPSLGIENQAGTALAYFTGTLADWVGVRFRYQKDQQLRITAAGASTAVTARHEGNGLTEVVFPSADPGNTISGTKQIVFQWPFHGFVDGEEIEIAGWPEGVSGIGTVITAMNQTHIIEVLNRHEFRVTHGNNNSGTNEVCGGSRLLLKFDGSCDPTRTSWFDESAFSDVRGWPHRVGFYEQRLVFGAAPVIPDTFFMSRSGSSYNFDTGDGIGADAIIGSLGSSQINLVAWFVPGRNLVVLCEGAEFHFPQANESGPLTPETARVVRGTAYGASAECKPVLLEGSVVFAQQNGQAIRQYSYAPDQFGVYDAPSLTTLATNLVDNPKQMAVSYGSQLGGEVYLFSLNGGSELGGELSVFNTNKDVDIAGWCKWTTQKDNTPTDGEIVSICNLGSNVYILVERDTGTGGDKFLIERLSENQYVVVDGAIEDTGNVGGNTFGGFSLYAGQTLSVCDADTGKYIGEIAVDGSGQIDAGEAGHSGIIAGFNFTATLEMLPPELQTQQGVTIGEYKGIFRSVIKVDGTHNFTANGSDIQICDDAASLPYTGVVELHHDGYGTDETLTIAQTVPEPLHIQSVHYEVDW